jgi:predicted O-linked N-acetylglucosamine transferase (SPINDLY family)
MTALFFSDVEAVQKYERELASDPRNFARCVEHLNAAPDDNEAHLRLLALRAVRKSKPPSWEPSRLESRQALRFHRYELELRHLEQRRRQVEKHFARLQAQGIAFFLHPFQSRGQRQQQRERMTYIRHCLRTGAPIKPR